MNKISDCVKEIFQSDYEALSAARNGYLDNMAYSRKIRKQVEQSLVKPVNLRTLSITLSRIVKDYLLDTTPVTPKLVNVFVHADLTEFTYEKTKENIEKVSELGKMFAKQTNCFFTITQSTNELTIICEQALVSEVKALFKQPPTFSVKDVVGITAKFSLIYLSQPNLIFEISRRLANKNVNIIEIVSSSTEITYIVGREEMRLVIEELTSLL